MVAEAHQFLKDDSIPPAIANARNKELMRRKGKLTKRLREIPGIPIGSGEAPPEEGEDGLITRVEWRIY